MTGGDREAGSGGNSGDDPGNDPGNESGDDSRLDGQDLLAGLDGPDEDAWDPVRVRRVAMELLARREHTRAELVRKLTQRGAAAELLEPALGQLEADGLQSDERYAEAFVRSRVGRGQGPVRIRHELGQRGVASELAETALADAETDWEALAADVRRRRFGPEPPGDFRNRARQARFLTYRGFSAEQVRHALES